MENQIKKIMDDIAIEMKNSKLLMPLKEIKTAKTKRFVGLIPRIEFFENDDWKLIWEFYPIVPGEKYQAPTKRHYHLATTFKKKLESALSNYVGLNLKIECNPCIGEYNEK